MDTKPEKFVRVGLGVIVLDGDGRVLLGQRKSKKFDGEGTWSLPGGHLEYGESFEQGGAREVKEETNLDVKKIECSCVQNNIYSDSHYVTIGMVVKDWDGELKNMEPHKQNEWRWFDVTALPEPLFLPSKVTIENFVNGKFYKADK